jgi:predicted MFS family arabinose efflux permease
VGRRWGILFVLFLARSAMGFQFQSIGSTAPFLIESLHINFASIGALIGLYQLPGVVVSMPGGLLTRRFGDKAICATGLLLMILGGLVLAHSQDLTLALVGRFISGSGAVLFNLVLTKMATDWFAGREIVLAMGVVLASWPFGIATGLVLQGELAVHLGWPAVMNLTAALSAVALLLVLVTYRPPPTVIAHETAPNAAPGSKLKFPPRRQVLQALIAGWAWGNLNAALVIFFSFAPLVAMEHGLSQTQAASVTSYGLWVSMLSLPLCGYVVQRSGRPGVFIIIFSLVAAAVLGLFSIGNTPALMSLAFGIVLGFPAGAILALPARILQHDDRAAGLGVFYTCYYAVFGLGPAVAGAMRDRIGTGAAALLFGAALLVAIAPLLLLIRRLAPAAARPA